MKKLLDVAMPAVLRPSLLDVTLATFGKWVMGNTHKWRLIINVDPVGDGTLSEIEAVCHKYFDVILLNAPKLGSLNAAIKWTWERVESKHALYLEDDIVCIRSVRFGKMQAALDADPKLAYLQVPFRSFVSRKTHTDNCVEHTWVPERGYHIRRGKYMMTLQPGLMPSAFMRGVAERLLPTPDPEFQFQGMGNPKMRKWIDQWEYGTYATPGEERAIVDIGHCMRHQAEYAKIALDRGTTWVPIKTTHVNGKPIRYVDSDVGRETWKGVDAGAWRADAYKTLDALLRPGDVVMDFGAYIGTIALYAAHTASRVIAFEPDPEARQVLVLNVKHNVRLREKFTLSAKAVGLIGANKAFGPWRQWGDSRGGLWCGDNPGAFQVGVGAISAWAEVYEAPKVDYIKITTVGSEAAALRGSMEWLAQHKPTLHIYMQKRYYKDWTAALADVGKVVAMYKHLYDEHGREYSWDEYSKQDNLLFVITDRTWGAEK